MLSRFVKSKIVAERPVKKWLTETEIKLLMLYNALLHPVAVRFSQVRKATSLVSCDLLLSLSTDLKR